MRKGCNLAWHVSFRPPPELYDTGTIRKHWNQATKYAETKRVHGTGSEIHAVVCGPKIAVDACMCKVSSNNTHACM